MLRIKRSEPTITQPFCGRLSFSAFWRSFHPPPASLFARAHAWTGGARNLCATTRSRSAATSAQQQKHVWGPAAAAPWGVQRCGGALIKPSRAKTSKMIRLFVFHFRIYSSERQMLSGAAAVACQHAGSGVSRGHLTALLFPAWNHSSHTPPVPEAVPQPSRPPSAPPQVKGKEVLF